MYVLGYVLEDFLLLFPILFPAILILYSRKFLFINENFLL